MRAPVRRRKFNREKRACRKKNGLRIEVTSSQRCGGLADSLVGDGRKYANSPSKMTTLLHPLGLKGSEQTSTAQRHTHFNFQ